MSPAPPSGEAAGYGKAAKRLSGWAANLLASGLILVTGLALGRQVLQWWQADTADANARRSLLAPDRGALGNLDQPHLLEFGNVPFALRRDPLTGNKATAFAALREQGLRIVNEPIGPRGKAGPAELRMLSQIGAQKPSAQSPGRWELYELDGPILLVAGIQFFRAKDGVSNERRVVFWGLAVPNGVGYPENEAPWTLFSFHPASGASESSPVAEQVTLPSDVPITLSLATEDGGRIIGFRAGSDSVALSRDLEQALKRQGWKLAAPWRDDAGAWQGRFDKRGQAADVQWDSKTGSGLVTVTPAPPTSGANDK